MPLLICKNLTKIYQSKKKQTIAAWNISFQIEKGKTLALVGKSGSGKTTIAKALLKLNGETEGQVFFEGEEILSLSLKNFRGLRRKMQMVFQDPHSSLNPKMTVEKILKEPFLIHKTTKSTVDITPLLERVYLPSFYKTKYPHELSGGEKQRVAIARALALHPSFIILDEPLASLDSSTQASIIALLKNLQKELKLTYLLISHDLAVVKDFAEDIAVIKEGRILEQNKAPKLFQMPEHPYTKSLLENAFSLEKALF